MGEFKAASSKERVSRGRAVTSVSLIQFEKVVRAIIDYIISRQPAAFQ